MFFGKTLAVALLGFGAAALAAEAAEAAPSNFCRRLRDQPEKDSCKADRLKYCNRILNHADPAYRGFFNECSNNVDGADIVGPLTNARPRQIQIQQPIVIVNGGNQGCNAYKWGDMPNYCITSCESAPRGRPWCRDHCDNQRSKGRQTPNWCNRA